ncbi:SDR family NAD(P)-dependent oxidoreductase [Sphaerotilus mobilis]|uniref:NAD(P)-dependent dehydrogenase (Short-subunit alcohol dehydrogenase family) n=1 Tax=Sphaerotilus mobilis TaxID=47994 RepID=A0A4Q7LSN5_9BURK|nr:SDR family oxidoreductase [Sphaerotilus mobilis]RZS56669.1 NAD(P)-dependent dehydrogenase (short-subunit alcohol dehydrogenase family) [Sphaerotilus mobilis]
MTPSALARYPSLEGRVVLVTGGATGIGATLVEHFVAQGSRVGFIDLAAEEGAALAARLAASPGTPAGVPATAPVFVPADLTDVDALRAAIAQVRQALGPIGVLLNNAANDRRHSIESVTSESWDHGIAVNLKHPFFCAQAVIEDMRQAGGGSIVNFGSLSWMIKQGGMPVYTTSKSAIQGLTRSLARDFGPHRVRVNTLLPGWVMTDKQLRLWVNDETRAEISRSQCIDAPLLPVHIASMALFLAADDSAMCTAQTFTVDGGWT